MIRVLLLPLFILICGGVFFGQDGSDMNYVYPSELDKSHVGRRTHIDFYRKSRGTRRGDGFNIDRISLDVGGKQIEFIEHREDDGFNNWFSGQYLESADKTIRIREFRLTAFDEKTVTVIGYLNVEPFENVFVLKRSDIAQFLMKAVRTK